MASNRGRTGPERALASALWLRGLRYLTSDGYRVLFGSQLAGSPDLIFSRKRAVIFVDGCFWHGCLECRRLPEGYDPIWVAKITRTVERDQRISAQLQRDGWTVIRVPEHEVRTKSRLAETADKLADTLRQIGRNEMAQSQLIVAS